MLIINTETGEHIKEYNAELGKVQTKEFNVEYRYVVDRPAVRETRVVAEYPNGGKDIATVEIEPEKGHWEVVNDFGKVLDYPIQYDTKGFDKTKTIPDVYKITYFTPFTETEIKKIEAEKAKLEEEFQITQDAIKKLPDTIETQNDIVLVLAELLGA